ncbi:MAG: enoyl-CoA hydratase-related protein [Porticoccaceae bacterium]
MYSGKAFLGLAEEVRATPPSAAVEGVAFGGGVEVVMACDQVVAAANARFGVPEVKRGLNGGWSMSCANPAVRWPRRSPPTPRCRYNNRCKPSMH